MAGPGEWKTILWAVFSDGSYTIRVSFIPEQTQSRSVEKNGTMKKDRFAGLCAALAPEWKPICTVVPVTARHGSLNSILLKGLTSRAPGSSEPFSGTKSLNGSRLCFPGKASSEIRPVGSDNGLSRQPGSAGLLFCRPLLLRQSRIAVLTRRRSCFLSENAFRY